MRVLSCRVVASLLCLGVAGACLFGCGGSEPDPNSGVIEIQMGDASESNATATPSVMTELTDDMQLDVLGLIEAKAHGGDDAIGVVVRLANNGDDAVSLGSLAFPSASQGGKLLSSAWVDEPDGFGFDEISKVLSKGESATCVFWFELGDKTADVDVSLVMARDGSSRDMQTCKLADAHSFDDGASSFA